MTNTTSQFRDHLARLEYPEYAHTAGSNNPNVLDLSLMHGTLPPGAEDILTNALREAAETYTLAQDPSLISLLAEQLHAPAETIIITAGADDALRIAAQYCIRPGTRTLLPIPCFGRYEYHAGINEAEILRVPFVTYPFELDATEIIAAARQQKAECLFVASPNSPTGHALDRGSVGLLLGTVPSQVILDESLMLDTRGGSFASLASTHSNLFVCGSLSKLYGLPGLRLGYLVANGTDAVSLRKLVSPFGVDALTLAVGKYMIEQTSWLSERVAATRSGIATLRSIGNTCIRVSNTSAAMALVEYTEPGGNLHDMLLGCGVLTVAANQFPGLAGINAVRVIISSEDDMAQLGEIVAGIS